jgi:hypothetical protein
MAVYFFYRCPYQGPAGNHLKRFDDDTVLGWFRARYDLWASAHPDLANAILRYVRRWDVLSTSRSGAEYLTLRGALSCTAGELGDLI